MQLEDCQSRPLELAFSRDGNGYLRYKTILWSWPKKSAKSSVVAAVSDYTAEHRARASIKLIGNDLKQADSRVGYYLRENIKLGQRANIRSKAIKITPSGYKVEYPNGSKVEMLPIDPTGEAGGNDDLIVYSELWGWRTTAQLRMWEEMTLSPTKPDSQRWIDTYAGFVGGSPLLEPLYEIGVKQGYRVWVDLEVYANDAAKVLAVWVTKPMFSWQTPDYYAEQANTLTPAAFARMHRNEWVSDDLAFVPLEWWHACRQDIAPLNTNEPIVLAMDAAVSNDCFGIVGMSRQSENTVAVRYAQAWSPPQGGKIDYAQPEAEIRRLCDTYNVVSIVYDEYQLHDMATRLKREGVAWMKAFSQAQPRIVADKLLYDLIRERRIAHHGEPELAQHIANADQKAEGDKLRIVKRNEHLKIDLAVCASMAAYETLRLNL